MAEFTSKVLIIGSGPAGYTAGIYAARAGLEPLIVSGDQLGGQLTMTTDVENFPGFPTAIDGNELVQRMREQAQNTGVKIHNDKIIEVDFQKRPFICVSENNNIYSATSIIIATGATARWLGLDSETKYRGFGVSACATCDGFFYRNRDVAVIGGGNTAAKEALHLTNFASSVTIIHRRDALRADKAIQEKLFENKKIHIEWNSVVEEVLGNDTPKGVTGLKLRNLKDDSQKIIPVEGIFIAVGHHPNTEVFKNQVDLDKEGYIITQPNSSQTNIDGVFAAGDVQNPHFRQAIVAAGSGCIAALEAEKYLLDNKLL